MPDLHSAGLGWLNLGIRLARTTPPTILGASMKAPGPPLFMGKVSRKAENAGGSWAEFNAPRVI